MLQVRQQLVQDVEDAERKQQVLEEQIQNAKRRQQEYQNQAKRGRDTLQQLTQTSVQNVRLVGGRSNKKNIMIDNLGGIGSGSIRGVQSVLETAKRLVQENQRILQDSGPLEQERELLEQELQAIQRRKQSQQAIQRVSTIGGITAAT